jgi:DNA polymerase V
MLSGFRNAKAGVILMDFYEQGALQSALFRSNSGKKASKALMSIVDQLNTLGRFGSG